MFDWSPTGALDGAFVLVNVQKSIVSDIEHRYDQPMETVVEVDPDAVTLDDLPHLIATHERLGAAIATAISRLDHDGTWANDGSLTMAAWLRHHCRLSARDARRWQRAGRLLSRYPAIRAAALDHRLSGGQLDAIRGVATEAVAAILDRQHAELVDAIAGLSVADSERVCRYWKAKADALADGPPSVEPDQTLSLSTMSDGTLVGRFTLGSATAAQFRHALDTATTWNAEDTRTPTRRRVDALHDICAFYNANHHNPGTPRHRAHVEIVITSDELTTTCCAETSDGHALAPLAADAHLCDAVLHRLRTSPTAVLDYGRATRTVKFELFRTIARRDHTCRYPGCDRPPAHCQAHHIHHWRHGGPTKPDNLVLLCSRHHHLIHHPGWRLHLDPADHALTVTDPTGLARTTRPPPTVHPPPALLALTH